MRCRIRCDSRPRGRHAERAGRAVAIGETGCVARPAGPGEARDHTGKAPGARSAGAYLDKATGKLTVTVTDISAAQSVRAANAIPRMVARGRAALGRATDALDRSARIPAPHGW